MRKIKPTKAKQSKENFKEVKPTARIDMSVSVVPDENPRNLWGIFDGDFTNPTPELLKYYLECSRKGFNFWIGLFFNFIRQRDLFIKSVCQTRKLPITAKEFVIEGDNEEHNKFYETNITSKKWFLQFIADCVEANIAGLSIFEINYTIEALKVVIENIKLIPNELTLYHDKLAKYLFLDIQNNDGNVLKTIGINANEDRIDFTRLKIIDLDDTKKLEVHALDGSAGNGLRNGFIDGLIWSFLRKNYAKKDFAMFLEKWADPPIDVAYENYLGEEGRKNAKKAAENYGVSKYAVHSKDIEFNIKDEAQKSATGDLFMSYINDEKEDISIAILGQTLTTKIGDKGSYAAADVHDRVRKDLQLADMIIVTLAVNELIERLHKMNFPGTEAPRFKFVSQVDMEFMKAIAVVVRDLRVAGFKVVADEISKTLGMTLIETTPVGGAADPNMKGAEDTTEPADDETTDDETKDDKKKKDDDEGTKSLSMTIEELQEFAKEYSKQDTKGKIALLIKKIYNENKPEN